MPQGRFLSADPNAGRLLSSDPAAGVIAQQTVEQSEPAQGTMVGGYPVGTYQRIPGKKGVVPGHYEATNNLLEYHPPAGAGSNLTRPDNSVAGLPPELAAIVLARGAGSIAGSGPGLATKAITAGKELLDNGSAIVKYEAVKYGLTRMGMPEPVAAVVAAGASGYKPTKGRAPRPRAAKAETTPVAAPAPVSSPASTPAPRAPEVASSSVPASPTPRAASPAPTSASVPQVTWSQQRIQNEVGIANRRAGANLSDEEYAAAEQLVKAGRKPAEAVTEVASRRPAPTTTGQPPTPTSPRSAASTKPSQGLVEETPEYLALRRSGKSHEETLEALQQQRAFAEAFGTPTPKEVRSRVARRLAKNNRTSEEQ